MGAPAGAPAQSRLERHLHTLGVLWIVIGGLFVIPFAILMLLGTSTHFIFRGGEPFGVFGPLILYLGPSTLIIITPAGVWVGLGLIPPPPFPPPPPLSPHLPPSFHPPSPTALPAIPP